MLISSAVGTTWKIIELSKNVIPLNYDEQERYIDIDMLTWFLGQSPLLVHQFVLSNGI